MMRLYRYPLGAISADYARGLGGIVLTAGPLWTLAPGGPLAWVLAACLLLFLVYFVRAVVRHLTRIELSETGIAARGPFGGAIPWDELRSVKLNYYTTRSDRTGGWMQLDLGTRQRSICVDSRLEGFAELAGTAAQEALRRGQRLDEATFVNLKALGIRCDGNA
jgi:hypothetical protein